MSIRIPPSITKINFLRYNEDEWQRIAGNEFAYCKRLRASDYLRLFDQLGLAIIRQETEVDHLSLQKLKESGLSLSEHFATYSHNDLCNTSLRALLEISGLDQRHFHDNDLLSVADYHK